MSTHSATRRRVAAATAWSVPVIAVASTAPAYATSIRAVTVLNLRGGRWWE